MNSFTAKYWAMASTDVCRSKGATPRRKIENDDHPENGNRKPNQRHFYPLPIEPPPNAIGGRLSISSLGGALFSKIVHVESFSLGLALNQAQTTFGGASFLSCLRISTLTPRCTNFSPLFKTVFHLNLCIFFSMTVVSALVGLRNDTNPWMTWDFFGSIFRFFFGFAASKSPSNQMDWTSASPLSWAFKNYSQTATVDALKSANLKTSIWSTYTNFPSRNIPKTRRPPMVSLGGGQFIGGGPLNLFIGGRIKMSLNQTIQQKVNNRFNLHAVDGPQLSGKEIATKLCVPVCPPKICFLQL